MSDSAKVGAGGTASGRHGRPLDVEETSAWLFDTWEKMRKRDHAALTELRARADAAGIRAQRRYRLRQALVFVLGGAAGVLTAAAYFSIGAI